MARAYSDDLRRKLLEAYQAGEGSLPELAARFRVSVGWAKHISATLTHTGQMERPAGGKRGRRSRVTAEAQEYLASQVKKQPDRTLAMLQEDLQREYEIQIGITQLWNILNRMGLRFKKSHSTLLNRTVSGSQPKENSGGKKANRSTRSASSSLTKAVSPRK
jgi:transposase